MTSYTRSPKCVSLKCADHGHADCPFIVIRFDSARTGRKCPATVLAWTALQRHIRKAHAKLEVVR